jgi:hypothetical protein
LGLASTLGSLTTSIGSAIIDKRGKTKLAAGQRDLRAVTLRILAVPVWHGRWNRLISLFKWLDLL